MNEETSGNVIDGLTPEQSEKLVEAFSKQFEKVRTAGLRAGAKAVLRVIKAILDDKEYATAVKRERRIRDYVDYSLDVIRKAQLKDEQETSA